MWGQIGNLSFYTTEEQIYELFSKCANSEDGGGIKRVIMGLDRNTRCVKLFASLNLMKLFLEQDAMWILLCGVLYPCRSTGMHEIC